LTSIGKQAASYRETEEIIMTREQEMLVAEIQRAFGDKCFDTTSVILKARVCPELARAIEVAIPNSRRRRSIRFRKPIVRRALTDLAREHFTTDQAGWWRCAAPTNGQK
jgi:hypothetical protein